MVAEVGKKDPGEGGRYARVEAGKFTPFSSSSVFLSLFPIDRIPGPYVGCMSDRFFLQNLEKKYNVPNISLRKFITSWKRKTSTYKSLSRIF